MTRTWIPESEQPKPRTGVDYREVKAWFQQCRDLAEQVEDQKQKIQRIRDITEKCTQSISGMPVGDGAGDKVGSGAGEMVDEKRTLEQMEKNLSELCSEATRRINCLSGSVRTRKQADCIYGYYVENHLQREIAESVGLKNASAVSVYIREGIEVLAEIWKDIQTDR